MAVMGREIKMWEGIIVVAIFVVAVGLFVEALLEMTAYPMMANYRECGMVFLCSAQK